MIPCVGYDCRVACCDDVRPWLLYWSICFALGLMIPCVGYACCVACCDDVRPWLLHWSFVVLGRLCVEFLSLLCTWPDDSVCWV